MFTHEYIEDIHVRLNNSLDERKSGKNLHETEWNERTLKIFWEPGDMTRYTAYAMVVPDGREDFAVLVAGTMTNTPFVVYGTPEGFLGLGYFLEKNANLGKHNLYTKRKLCQLVAAILRRDTDANDPVDYDVP